MLEAEIIAHCAPTLAGIKTANMFTYTPGNRDDLQKEIEEMLGNLQTFVCRRTLDPSVDRCSIKKKG